MSSKSLITTSSPPKKHINIIWVPSHFGIVENELADKMANEVVTNPDNSQNGTAITSHNHI